MKNNYNKLKQEKGVTLIALVITLIVLMIIAGLTITATVGGSGIINRVQQAQEDFENKKEEEQRKIEETRNKLKSSSLEQLKKTGEFVTKKTTVKDSNGNKVVIPQGFKVASDSGINVTEGIVIEDNDIIEGIGNNRGNQYVWVPVSNINADGSNKIKLNDGSETEITLGRYSFDTTTGEETLVQKGSEASEVTSSNYSDSSNDKYKINAHYELSDAIISDGSTTNTTAQNLSGFIESVRNNNGFYIARYEATYGEDGKANSKKSDNVSQWSPSRTEGSLWNKISEIDSSVACQNLYTGKANSDLLNSYAWDTTVKYLQSAGYTNYSNKIDGNGSIRNTGNTTDIACKIYDMAGNVFEWTTEIYGAQNNGSLVGGCFGYTTAYTSNRGGISPWGSYGDDGFRPILWL